MALIILHIFLKKRILRIKYNEGKIIKEKILHVVYNLYEMQGNSKNAEAFSIVSHPFIILRIFVRICSNNSF